MKLLRKVEKMEQEKARAAASGRPIALVWTSDNQTIDESIALEPGQHIARDVQVIREGGGPGQMPPEYRIVERVTSADGDHGRVEDAAGRIVGKVHASEPPYLDLEWFEK